MVGLRIEAGAAGHSLQVWAEARQQPPVGCGVLVWGWELRNLLRIAKVEGGSQSQIGARQQNSFQGGGNKAIMFAGKALAH